MLSCQGDGIMLRASKMLLVSHLILLGLAVPSMAQDDGTHSTAIMKMMGPDGNAMVTVVTDGVPQTFTVAPDGSLIGSDGQTAAPFQGPPGGKGAPSGNAQPFILKGPGGADLPPAAQQAMQQAAQQAQQRAQDALKDALGCSDSEWAVLWPKIQ